jgi:hypothetical protein
MGLPVHRDTATAVFFDGVGRGEFLLGRCECGEVLAPAQEQCPRCGHTEITRFAAAGGARVISYTVSHARPVAGAAPSRTVLVIGELDEGPWWWSTVTDADADTIGIGDRLTIDFEDRPGSETVPVFRLDASHNTP